MTAHLHPFAGLLHRREDTLRPSVTRKVATQSFIEVAEQVEEQARAKMLKRPPMWQAIIDRRGMKLLDIRKALRLNPEMIRRMG